MIRRPPRSTRTDTLVPYTTLFRSGLDAVIPAEFAEQRQFFGIEACADRPVTDDAGGTVGHPSAIIDYAARGKRRRSKERLGHAEVAPGAGRPAIGPQRRKNSRNAAAHSPPATALTRISSNGTSGPPTPRPPPRRPRTKDRTRKLGGKGGP